jgi:hypothetical protein
MLRVRTIAAVWVALLVLSGTAVAQIITGNIRGTVTDETGAVLPGATVTIASPALIGGPKTAVTNSTGVYRFPAVAIGDYAVEITMDGFQKYRVEDVRVPLNKTATVNATLTLSTVAETVTVTGEGPVLDVTKSGHSTNWDPEMVEQLPTNRNFWDYAQMSPGVGTYSPDGQGSGAYAYGGGWNNNSWNVDGIPLTSNDTGASWYWINPDMIEEVEVSGIGAPAEYGNATGGTINIVTKTGGNEFHGGANFFFQTDALTDTAEVVNGFGFHREKYQDFTAQVGGPISQDKVWFMAAYQYQRDWLTQPGNDPDFFTEFNNDRFDLKLTAQVSENNKIDGAFHYEIWECCQFVSPFVAPDAVAGESGTTPSWKVGWTSVLNDTTLLELRYAGWWGDDIYQSVTGSQEQPFIDYSPPGGGPTTYSGGASYLWDYFQWTHQITGKVTKYAEDFLNSQHDFKFGVQWGYGTARTDLKLGPDGSYSYNYLYEYDYYGYIYEYQYLYRVSQLPYTYGGRSTNLGLFIDDTVTIGDKLTLNLGLRFDHHNGDLADSQILDLNFEPVGVWSPGADGLINWNNWSPRLGFAFTPVKDGGALIKGTAGIYWEQNVMGNWNGQIENDSPPWNYFTIDPITGEDTGFCCEVTFADQVLNFDLKNSKATQFSIGYEQQLASDVTVGVQYVYKEVVDYIGWDILGGSYQGVPYTDPFTGNQWTLLEQLEAPTVQKGNGPFLTDNILQLLPETPRYQSEYNGGFFTLNKRFSNGWGLSSSYTWSKSEGLVADPQSAWQGNTAYSSRDGSNPNNFINARQRLQADRPHMFRLQGVFNLPGDVLFSTSFNFLSGVPFSRQVRLFNLGPSSVAVIMARAGSDEQAVLSTGKVLDSLRLSQNKVWDLRIGKRFPIGESAAIKVDGTVFNILNDDAEIWLQTLELNEGDVFEPVTWLLPRRLMVYVGFEF